MSSHPTTTVAGYLLRQLAEAGVRSVFGARGADDLVLFHAVTGQPELTWIETATERDAGYAADGYARLRGLGAMVAADRPVRGAAAGSAPVVHIVAAQPIAPREARQPVRPPVPAGPAHTDLRPGTATAEIDRILATALRTGRPVYVSLPADVAIAPVPAPAGPPPAARPDDGPLSRASLRAAVQEFLAPGDVLVADQTALDGSLTLPDGAQLLAAPCPAPASWAGPAALGASLAAPDRRVVVLTSGPDRLAGLGALVDQGVAPVMIVASEDGTRTPAAVPSVAAAEQVTSAAGLAGALRAASRQAGRLILIAAALGHPDIHQHRSPRAAA